MFLISTYLSGVCPNCCVGSGFSVAAAVGGLVQAAQYCSVSGFDFDSVEFVARLPLEFCPFNLFRLTSRLAGRSLFLAYLDCDLRCLIRWMC